MAKKMMILSVRGKQHEWGFEVCADEKYLQEWQDDGVEIYLLENTIPMWIVEAGLLKPWVFLQDMFNFKWPWRK